MYRAGLGAVTVAALGVGSMQHALASTAAPLPSAQQQQHVYANVDKDWKLKQVQVVFRHGARTPLTDKSYLWKGTQWDVCGCAYEGVRLQLQDMRGGPPPPSPHDDKQMATMLPGGCHKGELTLVGQRQALELGWWLRQQYIDTHRHLPASYREGIVAPRTTNYSRTRASLQGVLTGLYPHTEEAIPVATASHLDEVLFADTERCPHLGILMQASEAMLQKKIQEERELRAQLQQRLGKALDLSDDYWRKNRWQFTDIHDAMTSMRTHGKPLPEGLDEHVLREVERLATQEFAAFISPSLEDDHGQHVMRLSMGRLLELLVQNIDAAAAGHDKLPLMYLYSGHDSTVMPMLVAMGGTVDHWPPYMSNVIIELWAAPTSAGAQQQQQQQEEKKQKEEPLYVRVLYNKEPIMFEGAPKGARVAMELSAFKERLLAPYLLTADDHAEACRVPEELAHDSALPKPMNLSSASSGD